MAAFSVKIIVDNYLEAVFMNKKFSIFGIVALSLITIGEVSFALGSSPKANSEVERAESESVTFSSIAWNNIDYANPILMPAPETHYVPQYGYLVLLQYSALFNPTSSDNFAHTNNEWASYIKINGKTINQVDNSVARIYAGDLYIYFPDSEITYTNDYFRPTIEILNGAPIYNLILPYTRLEYKYSIGADGKWENTTNFARENVSYSSIAWNNTHYNDESYPALGGKNALLLAYNSNLSTNTSESGGIFVQNRNLKNTIVGDNITLNGTPFNQINGAEIRYFNQNYLWLYAPNMTVPGGDAYATIEISSVIFFDKILDSHTFYFLNSRWVDNLNVATFSSIAWNNRDYWGKAPDLNDGGIPQNGYIVALLYSENIGPGSDQAGTNDVNMANDSYDIGRSLLINGVPCKDISGAMVGSYLTPQYLYIYFPDSSIAYSNEYDRPTIEILDGCLFYNYILPSIKLEFVDVLGVAGKWQTSPVANTTSFAQIDWNNTDYDFMGGKNGLLLTFTDYLSTSAGEINGGVVDRNLVNTTLGQNFKLNGVPLNQVPGGEIKYFHTVHLWVYAPTMTTPSNGYTVPHLELSVPTEFFDVIIPAMSFNFTTIWVVDSEQYVNRTSFSSFYPEHNNVLMDNGIYRDTILCFDQFFADSDKNNTDLIATNEEFVNKVTLNGVALKNVPGIFVIYMGNNYIHLMIRVVDETPTAQYPNVELHIPQDTHLFNYFINEVSLYMNNDTYEWMKLDHETVIKTQDEATFRTTGLTNQITGMCFENRLHKDLFDSLVNKYGMENISFGTYIVPKSNYLNSNASSPIDYINSNTPGSSTYVDVANTKKDFANAATAASDGYYTYTASIYNIKTSHYAEGFIGVGYLTVNGRTYYGNLSDNSTTFYDLLVQAYNSSLINNSYFNTVISFTTTANAYELSDNSIVSTGYSVSYSSKGYYQLTANKDIKTIVIDGVPYKTNIRSGQATYFAYYNGVIDYRTSLNMSKGIGEPIYELFPDSTNSNANFDTAGNVSSFNQAFGANGERIWLDLGTGLGTTGAGYNEADENGVYHFDEAKVTRLHNYLAQFTSKGITELTLLVHGWANAKDAPIFLKDGNWYSFAEAVALGGASRANVIPTQTTTSYQKWLDVNENLAYQIAKEFPEFKYVEFVNEIDGGGHQYSPEYVTNSTIPSIATVASWAMDLCHAASKGVRKAHSTLRVMTPAFSCLDAKADTYHYYNTKNFITNCYTYIENSADTNTNNWFQVMNLHPYVFPTKNVVGEDSVYLWNSRPPKSYPYSLDNTNYDTDWINYMNYVHNTIMSSHKDAKKSIAITEFGFSDLGNTTDSYWKYANYNNRYDTIATNIMNKINSVDYIETLIWFRLFDWEVTGSEFGFAQCLEPNFGLINENKTLKNLGKKLYQLWNGGSTDYSAITSYMAVMEERN